MVFWKDFSLVYSDAFFWEVGNNNNDPLWLREIRFCKWHAGEINSFWEDEGAVVYFIFLMFFQLFFEMYLNQISNPKRPMTPSMSIGQGESPCGLISSCGNRTKSHNLGCQPVTSSKKTKDSNECFP